MDVSAFDFDLPSDLVAQEPSSGRDEARLLHLAPSGLSHARVSDLPARLRPGDLLLANDTRVFPARLLGRRVPSGGSVECLLVSPLDPQPGRLPSQSPGALCEERWEVLVHPGQRLKPGARLLFEGSRTIHGEIFARGSHGRRLVRLWSTDASSIAEAVDAIGHVPLPPYIRRPDRHEDRERYQTVFADRRGSVAAPTAGLHFSHPLLAALRARGVEVAFITLHVGYGTFQPVRVETVEDHRLEPEPYDINETTAAAVNSALDEGRRVIAVGTTTTRALESAALQHGGRLRAGSGSTDLFIFPGFRFRVIAGLLTNFHLPRSSLLMLVSAFAGRDRLLEAYRIAVAERYRFYSYGDAMLIL
jgi:S-adenosylmethionine:tRNA ribosyltransferase-isomerase